MLSELGPFYPTPDGAHLQQNPNSWNKGNSSWQPVSVSRPISVMLLEGEWYAIRLQSVTYMTGMLSQAWKPKINMGQVFSVGSAYLSDVQWFCGLFCSLKPAFY